MVGKIKQKGLFRVSVYFSETELTGIAKEAEVLKFRRVGIPLKKQKPHGFANEWLANTDGIGRYLKYCAKYHKDNEVQRLEATAALLKKKEEIEAQLAKR